MFLVASGKADFVDTVKAVTWVEEGKPKEAKQYDFYLRIEQRIFIAQKPTHVS